MVICSSDLALTQATHERLLASIAPVVGSYYIRCEERAMARMLLLKDCSPYQKIDLGIVDNIARSAHLAPFACLYRSDSLPADTGRSFTWNGQRESLSNWLNDILFSIPRFTKCLFRGDRDCYRRWNGVVEAMMVLLFERHFGWSTHRYRLGPHEYKKLYDAMTSAETERVDRILPLNERPDIVKGFVLAAETIVMLYQQKAAALSQPLDESFAQFMLTFLAVEIQRYHAAAIVNNEHNLHDSLHLGKGVQS